MKSKLHIILFSILIGLLSGCEDFLALTPVSQANVEDFYKTPNDINSAVIAAYKMHKSTWPGLVLLRSDDAESYGLIDFVDNFYDDIGYGAYSGLWNSAYRAIYACNIAIEKAEGVTMPAELKNRYLAELKFIRGITYFELVRYWGGVPLITETARSLSTDVVNVSRNTISEVYNQILEDLTFAELHLPVSYTDNADIGRATKGAANGYLGKVYLTIGNKGAAETALRKVLTYGYQLLPKFEDVFGANNGNNKEIVFELQFKAELDPCGVLYAFHSMQIDVQPGTNSVLASVELFNAFDPNDPRRDWTLAKDKVDRYYCVKYKDPSANPISNANNNLPLLRYSEILLLLAESIGETPEAYNLINQVRQRVGLTGISSSTPGTFTQKLLNERRLELAFEPHRWHDLLRFGVAIEVMNAHFVKEKNGQITIGQNDLLFPIPLSAIINNPKLEQNPGYPNQ